MLATIRAEASVGDAESLLSIHTAGEQEFDWPLVQSGRDYGHSICPDRPLDSGNRAALKASRGDWAHGRVLLTDMVMPEGMSGRDLAERLKAAKPALKIVVSSGYSAQLVDPDSLTPGIAFLAKPFKPAPLAKLVRQCLD